MSESSESKPSRITAKGWQLVAVMSLIANLAFAVVISFIFGSMVQDIRSHRAQLDRVQLDSATIMAALRWMQEKDRKLEARDRGQDDINRQVTGLLSDLAGKLK